MIPLADVADDYRDILFWGIGSIILLIVLAAPLVWWLRKRLSPNEDFRGPGFTLSDLRQLHKSGQISDDEYERAKAKLIGGLKDSGEEQP